MIKIIKPLIGVLFFANIAFAQTNDSIVVVSYNVENLFDTIDDEIKKDEDFTPNGRKNWDVNRYKDKLNKLSKVLIEIDPSYPEIIGLIEIENKKVIEDLINETDLKNANYDIVHFEGPDIRGIDVALLYKNNSFKVLSSKPIPISFPFDSTYKTRDILHVEGILKEMDTVNFFINHWPSRRGGIPKSQPKRTHVASVLKHHVDSIFDRNINSKIIIMGDFNDNPTDKSVFEILEANNIKKPFNKRYLYNLMFNEFNNDGFGSYLYRNNYNMLDHIIISHSLFNIDKGYSTNYESGKVFSPLWLCDENNDKKEPFRTYKGPNYLNGYSDHFPVYFVLKKRAK